MNEYIRSLQIPTREFVVLSPDEGSIKRALLHQKKLGGSEFYFSGPAPIVMKTHTKL